MTDSYTIIAYPGDRLPPTYTNMIFAKWLRSLRYGNDYFRLISSDEYYTAYSRHINWVLREPDCTVKLAVLTEDHDVCLGYCVHRGTVLDYVHVQRDMRRLGIGTALLPPEVTTITNITRNALAIWNPKLKQVKFNPFT